ncbi:hypothetical protein ASE72_11725 [Sphingomonas sp. Leaf20]|nr:hypothetical protein ASE72_11725 [Sphingomonas sp. Leaf20]
MIWVLIGLSTVELVVVHLLLAHWWPRIAIAVAAVTLGMIMWLVTVVRAFRSMPVVLEADRLLMRTGRLRSVSVATQQIAGLRSSCDAATLKQRHVLNLALIAYPNTVIDLLAPVAVGRRQISTIAHRLDDPAGFADALNRLRPRA